jgi:hypothetical protein
MDKFLLFCFSAVLLVGCAQKPATSPQVTSYTIEYGATVVGVPAQANVSYTVEGNCGNSGALYCPPSQSPVSVVSAPFQSGKHYFNSQDTVSVSAEQIGTNTAAVVTIYKDGQVWLSGSGAVTGTLP